MMDKYHPGYFGKVGQRYFHKLKNRFFCPTINLDKIPQLVGDAKAPAGQVPVVDVTKAGYFKVLGKSCDGLPAMIVKAKHFSKLAEKKIKDAGGACVLTA